jgi:hypothetical protein
MDTETLEDVLLDRLGAQKEGDEYHLPEEREVTALLKTGAELLHVPKLRIVEFQSDSTAFITKDAEYFVEADDVFALKLEGSRVQPDASAPGFRRS